MNPLIKGLSFYKYKWLGPLVFYLGPVLYPREYYFSISQAVE